MKRRFGVFSPKDKKIIARFEFPKQAEKFIDKKGSDYLVIVDPNKGKK